MKSHELKQTHASLKPAESESNPGAHAQELGMNEKSKWPCTFVQHWAPVFRNAIWWTVCMMLATSFLYFLVFLFAYACPSNQCAAKAVKINAVHYVWEGHVGSACQRKSESAAVWELPRIEHLKMPEGSPRECQNLANVRFPGTSQGSCIGLLS